MNLGLVRFEELRIAGLVDIKRTGQPRTISHTAIVTSTLLTPKFFDVPHWSSRLLACRLKVSVYRAYGIKPWPSE